MSEKETDLDALRREIDAIDDQIHDLIMRRTTVVERVRDLKKSQKVKIRPAREAEILYRLAQRHRGAFPVPELIRIWRELIVATLPIEGPFSVAVYTPEDELAYWDLARDQYGSFTRITPHTSLRRVVDDVRRQESTVGVLPLPMRDEPQPWWPLLIREQEDTPRIIARLPFAGAPNSHTPAEALVICPIAQEPTGRDRTYLAIDGAETLTRPRLSAMLPEVGLSPRFLAAYHDEQRPEVWMYMIETEDFVAPKDARIRKLVDKAGSHVKRVVHLGGYAIPLTAEQLADNAE
jgi:chorismate mutase